MWLKVVINSKSKQVFLLFATKIGCYWSDSSLSVKNIYNSVVISSAGSKRLDVLRSANVTLTCTLILYKTTIFSSTPKSKKLESCIIETFVEGVNLEVHHLIQYLLAMDWIASRCMSMTCIVCCDNVGHFVILTYTDMGLMRITNDNWSVTSWAAMQQDWTRYQWRIKWKTDWRS